MVPNSQQFRSGPCWLESVGMPRVDCTSRAAKKGGCEAITLRCYGYGYGYD